MHGPVNDTRMQIAAVQLASVKNCYQHKTMIGKLEHRVRTEFLNCGPRGKAQFIKYLFGEAFTRLFKRRGKPPEYDFHRDQSDNRLHVAVICNGGMGDLIIYSAFLDRFYRECGHPIIHVLVHPLRMTEASFVFHDAPAVSRIVHQVDLHPDTTGYDVVVKLGDFSSYEFIRKDLPDRFPPGVLERLNAARERQMPYLGFLDPAPFFDGFLTTIAQQSGLRRLDLLGWLANMPFTQQDQLHLSPDVSAYTRYLDELGLKDRPYITIHNGWDVVAHRGAQTVTKAWPEKHYLEFVDRFKARHPELLIIQLGANTSKPLENADLCLVNDTTLHEAAWILKHALLHVDGDSGLVHFARALHTPSVVLFGPTNHDFFQYSQNRTLHSTNCSNCWWVTNDWMRACPRGLAEPECMVSITPDEVLEQAEQHLAALRTTSVTLEHEFAPALSKSSSGSPSPSVSSIPSVFDEFVQAVRHSKKGSSQNLERVAVLCGPEVPRVRFSGMDTEHTVFTLDCTPADDTSAEGPQAVDARRDAERDFGSFYNIPAEDDAYDLVVIPALTDRIAYPRFALNEALRILKDGGILAIAYTFTTTSVAAHDKDGVSCRSLQKFNASLEELGLPKVNSRSNSGKIMLKKVTSTKCIVRRSAA